MTDSHVISGLVEKRSELSGQIGYHQKQIKKIKASMTAIDTAVKTFDASYDLKSIKPKRINRKNSFFENREGSTLLMDIFREAKAPMSTHELMDKIIEKKGFDTDSIDVKALKASAFVILKRLQTTNVIKEVERDGLVIIWSLV